MLNAGHTAWLGGRVAEAVSRYRKALPEESPEDFLKEDAALLQEAGKTVDDPCPYDGCRHARLDVGHLFGTSGLRNVDKACPCVSKEGGCADKARRSGWSLHRASAPMQLVSLLSSLFHLHFLEMPDSSFMKKKCYLTSALSLLLNMNMQAQKPAEMEAYFLSTLRGEQVEKVPGKRFSMKHVDERREEVWQAWKRACAAYDGVQLPPLDSLRRRRAANGSARLLGTSGCDAFLLRCEGSEASEAGYPFFLYLHGSGPKQQEWQTGLVLAPAVCRCPFSLLYPANSERRRLVSLVATQ